MLAIKSLNILLPIHQVFWDRIISRNSSIGAVLFSGSVMKIQPRITDLERTSDNCGHKLLCRSYLCQINSLIIKRGGCCKVKGHQCLNSIRCIQDTTPHTMHPFQLASIHEFNSLHILVMGFIGNINTACHSSHKTIQRTHNHNVSLYHSLSNWKEFFSFSPIKIILNRWSRLNESMQKRSKISLCTQLKINTFCLLELLLYMRFVLCLGTFFGI